MTGALRSNQEVREYEKYENLIKEDINHQLKRMNGTKVFKKKEEFDSLIKEYKENDYKYYCGEYIDPRDLTSKFYDLYNRVSPEVDGITEADCLAAHFKIWLPFWFTLSIKS